MRDEYIFLLSTPGIGAGTLARLRRALWQHHLSWSDFLELGKKSWLGMGLFLPQADALEKMLQDYTPKSYNEYLQSKNISVILPKDVVYPKLLSEISDKPAGLFVQAKSADALSQLEKRVKIAVVGTRQISPYGRFATRKIVSELAAAGAAIISGLMYGVDLTAHETAIERGAPTVAVLGYGVDHLADMPYLSPDWLAEFVDKGGIFVSEYAPAVEAHKGTFVMRNRIIAGLSHATVVVEAAAKSGSLITASRAVGYNRLVCAVPGSIRNPLSEGTRALVNQGAMLICSGTEVLEELVESLDEKLRESLISAGSEETTAEHPHLHQHILDALRADDCTLEELMVHFTISMQEMQRMMTELEIDGRVERVGPRWGLTDKSRKK